MTKSTGSAGKRKSAPRKKAAAPPEPQDELAPRIVAIGASAGGLEPIEVMVQNIPPDTGLAFVIIQHLSPDFRSMMPELLARRSSLKIQQVMDHTLVEADTIYLNPPRSSISLKDGRFHLSPSSETTEPGLPISDIFGALADVQGADAIGVVLSGTGSDGTLGAQRIAAAGGTVLAQDPVTAKFDGMPRSVINAVPDVLSAAPHKLSEIVLAIAAGESLERFRQSAQQLSANETAEQKILRHLQERYGIDFGFYKTSTVYRRIERRRILNNSPDFESYVQSLAENHDELEDLYNDLLIGVTSFFRDADAFQSLKESVADKLRPFIASGREIRVWVAGCASGEEAYSIAIILLEVGRELGLPVNFRMFATDIHPRSLRVASNGVFPETAVELMPSELVDRYFERSDDGVKIDKQIRERIVFSRHNLIKDPPFSRVDLISCRNLLIYFNDEAQESIISTLHFALNTGGLLFLGPSETLARLNSEFTPINAKWRIYQKRRSARLRDLKQLTADRTRRAMSAGSALGPQTTERRERFAAPSMRRHALMRIYDAVLEETVGTAILVDENGYLLHVFSDANRFLTVPSGGFSLQLTSFAPIEFRAAFQSGLSKLRKASPGATYRTSVRISADDGLVQAVNVGMKLIEYDSDESDRGILISLAPVAAETLDIESDTGEPLLAMLEPVGDFLQTRIAELERDLRFTENELQTTIEELETSNEELQATNEELQATNEELMAANEELQTVNEEIYTVSAEHQAKILELTQVTDDLEMLLQSTEIGVVFLDASMQIRLLTPAVSRTFNIRQRDIGRPIFEVTSKFDFPELEETIKRVVERNTAIERAVTVDAHDYSLRILPYTRSGVPDGVVMTFVDITEIAKANRSLAQFADVVSHDLKSPLRAIRTAAEWTLEALGDNTDPDVVENIGLLKEQTDRLSRMLASLRDFSSQNPKSQPREEADLDDLVRDIAAVYPPDQIKLEIETPGIHLLTQKAALRLVLQNLIENAVWHSDTWPVTVRFAAREGAGLWKVTISDDGPGIDPRHHDRIFLPFRRLQASEHPAGGSGIGLALVQKTIREMGGAIEVRSDPGQRRGSEFAFTWPAA